MFLFIKWRANRRRLSCEHAMHRRQLISIACVLGFSLTMGREACADQMFFASVGMPVLSDPTDADSAFIAVPPIVSEIVPIIAMRVGDVRTLHVWYRFNPVGSNRAQVLSFDVDSSNPAVAFPSSASITNPEIRGTDDENPETPPTLRWRAPTTIDAIGEPGSPDWITNASASIGDAATSRGIGGSLVPYENDPGRDIVTRAFHVASLTIQATESGTAGLYFRVGAGRILWNRSGGVSSLQFGPRTSLPEYLGDAIGAGDPITQDLMYADAIIAVEDAIVPEPSSIVLVIASAISVLWVTHRKKHHRPPRHVALGNAIGSQELAHRVAEEAAQFTGFPV